jgi:aminoglycoside phosphotransferase (APT) family kinase protein
VHDNEVLADSDVVRRLLADQLPQLSDLPLTRLPTTGTDNLIYRLGDELAVRMPRVEWAVEQIARDHAWLPRIAPHLPCAVPTPIALGSPDHGYPFPWAVHRWLPGDNPEVGDDPELAADLADVVVALRQLTEGPPSSRSGPLSPRDAAVREAVAVIADEVSERDLLGVWDLAVDATAHEGVPVWRHADLTCGNLLVVDGRLSAVIDFGPSGLGDPAVDLVPCWRVFRGRARSLFRERVGGDEAAWSRARGWALSIAVLELAYYRDRDATLADAARVALREVLAG